MGAMTLLLAVNAEAQKKSAPAIDSDGVFSSDSRLVLIDSIVTDRKGAYIGDLTRKDFKVREDGKEQTLTSFSYLTDEAPDAEKRYLVLFFDNASMPQTDQHYARDAAMKFIGLNAGSNHLMSIVEFGGTVRVTQNLTGDMDRLKQAIIAPKLSVASAGAPGAVGIISRAGYNAASALPEALRNVAKGLAKVPGRKTIVLFSEGGSVSQDLMKPSIEECNRSNVAIYPVDIRMLAGKNQRSSVGIAEMGRSNPGLPQPGGQSDLSAPGPSDALYSLAQGTGGFVVSGPGQLPDDLARIAKEQSLYYVLGYLPAKEVQPGSCHAIKVDVDRGGAHVRSRTRYCDGINPAVVVGTSTERDLEARLNANAAPTLHATMQTPFFYIAPNTARVDLTLAIPGSQLKFAKDKGKFTASLNIIGIAYLPDGGVAARFNDTAKVALDDQRQVDEFASRPWRFEKQFEMASGAFDLKVAFSSGATGFGNVETHLVIDPWAPSTFLLSGLAISESTLPASSPVLGAEVDLFGDNVPLVANGVQFVPSGTNRLQKSKKAFIYGEIYEPALANPDRKGDPGVGAQMTVLNAKTGEIVKQTGLTSLRPETVAGTSAVPFGMMLPTDELSPGSYTAQITGQDAAGNRSLRRIAFEVEP